MINEANVQVVRKFLLGSGAADGAKLPTERALAQTLGLTRGVVRGALAVMEAEGHVLRKVGSGTYLVKQGGSGAAGLTAVLDVNPKQIVEARFAFEPYIAGIAAMNYTKQDMERLVQCAQEYHDADNFDAFEAADENFHTAIAAATHNPVVTSAYQSFAAAHAAAEWGGLRQRFLTAERRVASRKEHDRILAAIRSRDSEASVAAVRQHLDHIVSAILRQ
jgi:DNA-binding FadR family transcriptional regulator